MTKEARQQAVEAHIDQHGSFDLIHFVNTVAADPEHPAHGFICPEGWRDRAQHTYLVQRGQQFVTGLRINVEIKIADQPEPVSVPVPSLIADMRQPYSEAETRYVVPDDENYMDVLDARAERELRSWAEKYRAILVDPKRLRQLSAMVRRLIKGDPT